MRDILASYNRFFGTIVITCEILFCGLLFHLLLKWMPESLITGLNLVSVSENHVLFILMLCYAVCAFHSGVVLYMRKVKRAQIVSRVLENIFLFIILAGVILTVGSYLSVFSWFMFVYVLLLLACFLLFRTGLRKVVLIYRKRRADMRFVVLVGSSSNNLEIWNEISSYEGTGYVVSGYFDDSPNNRFPKECPYLGKPTDVTEYLAAHKDVHYLFCCLPSHKANIILPLINYCENHLVNFYSVPNVRNYLHKNMTFNLMGSVPYLSLRPEPLAFPENRIMKRAFDVAVSLVFICTLFPIILIIVFVITELTMPGPLFFCQKRNGLNGKEFKMIKFRSMKVNDDADRLQATKDDPRKTKWGNIMRKFNIDEFPQFINVLIGDMSVVGPRPHMLLHTDEYSKLINKYMVRHFVKPGVTGWSQVTGWRGETQKLEDMEGRVRGDIWYLEHWSFGLDLYIIYRTVANIFHGEENAY